MGVHFVAGLRMVLSLSPLIYSKSSALLVVENIGGMYVMQVFVEIFLIQNIWSKNK